MTYTINKSQNGILFKCDSCNRIHFEYKNLNFLFTEEEFRSFSSYIMKLNGEYWEIRNQESPHRRKVLVPIGHKNLKLGFNAQEIHELRKLFFKQEERYSVRNLAIDYQYSDN